jgi:hypothetical protein
MQVDHQWRHQFQAPFLGPEQVFCNRENSSGHSHSIARFRARKQLDKKYIAPIPYLIHTTGSWVTSQ